MQDECITKRCSRCNEYKSVTEFYFKDKVKGTLQSHCKSCLIAASNAKYHAEMELIREVRRNAPAVETMVCLQCGIEKPLAEMKRRGQGYRSLCKQCNNAAKAEYRIENADLVEQSNAAYREANREKLRQTSNEWRAEHPTEIVAITRKSRQKNADKRLVYNQTYRAANPDVYRLAWQKRHALQLSTADGTVTVEAWQELVAYYGGCCAYCGEPVAVPEQEHVVPLSKGGAHTIDNLAPACRACNARKSNKTLVEYLLAGGGARCTM